MTARDALVAALKANNPPEWGPYADAIIADLSAAGFCIVPVADIRHLEGALDERTDERDTYRRLWHEGMERPNAKTG